MAIFDFGLLSNLLSSGEALFSLALAVAAGGKVNDWLVAEVVLCAALGVVIDEPFYRKLASECLGYSVTTKSLHSVENEAVNVFYRV